MCPIRAFTMSSSDRQRRCWAERSGHPRGQTIARRNANRPRLRIACGHGPALSCHAKASERSSRGGGSRVVCRPNRPPRSNATKIAPSCVRSCFYLSESALLCILSLGCASLRVEAERCEFSAESNLNLVLEQSHTGPIGVSFFRKTIIPEGDKEC